MRAGAHCNTCTSVGPIRVQNLKAIRALESAYNRYPHLPWALWENRKYHNCGPGRAHYDNFHTRVSSFIGQHFGKKIGLLPTAGAENHAFGGFHTPPTNAPQSLRKRDLREKPRNLLQSDEQCPGAPLSHLRKIPSATSGSNKGVKIVPKPFQGLLLGTRGTENLTQCLTMKHWSGANFWHQFLSPSVKVTRASFRPGRLLWPNGA